MADNDNTITLVGRIGQEPELRMTPQGADVLNFSIATSERRRGADGSWSDGPTSWFRVAVWGELGRNAHRSLHRGQQVIVHGVLKVTEYRLEGGGRSQRAEVRATAVGHDLRWGATTFTDAREGAAQVAPAAPVEREPEREPALETVPPAAPADWGGSLAGDETPF
jgi:single-strand DNA-binding protein